MTYHWIRFFLVFIGYSFPLAAQVGVGTTSPNASLDIVATDASSPKNTDGLLIPRLQIFPNISPTSNQHGMLIYLTTTIGTNLPGFYYWDSSTNLWIGIKTSKDVNTSWSLTGNNDVTDTCFLGSTTDMPLVFKINNQISGKIDGKTPYNTSLGYQSLLNLTTGQKNTVLGVQALNKNTTGSNNLASGYQALFSNISGDNNNAIGYQSLYNNTTGINNCALGYSALNKNTTGSNNLAVGHSALANSTSSNNNNAFGVQSLSNNLTGTDNNAFGYRALFFNKTGSINSAFGNYALNFNTTGGLNSAFGYAALYYNTTGKQNTAIGFQNAYLNTTGTNNTSLGYRSLYNNTTGNYNTALGFEAGTNVNNLENTTSIGNGAIATTSNMVRIGNNNVTIIEGNVAWSNPSDRRIKQNVQENVPGLSFINALRPVTYTIDNKLKHSILNPGKKYNEEASEYEKAIQTGFIAQEVEAAANKLGYAFDGVNKPTTNNSLYSLSYSTFVVPLVKAVQEQQKEIEKLKKENERLKKIEERLADLESKLK